ncbi:MAG: transcription termination/antitermination protein NusA [Candidatus Kerfeldbacteria bacterium]|nr:transcription termination/antitermination protein NusA [Candidatus Kerfeldbacteria bacterium]
MPDPKEVGAAIKQICEEKGIPFEAVIETIETALAVAYRKEMGQKGKDIRVEFNPNDGTMRVFEVTTVVEDELYDQYLKDKAAREAAGEDPAAPASIEATTPMLDEHGEPVKRFNPKTDIGYTEAKAEVEDIEIGDEIRDEVEVPSEFGRMAAQTAKQVIIQKLREAERETLFNLYQDRTGEVINAMIQRVEGKVVFVDLGQAIAVMPPSEQVRSEVYKPGQRIKVLLLSIEKTNRGPEIVASRSHPNLVSALFTTEVPEIAAGSVVIKGVAREAGSRTKIAVAATDPNIDPIGSCVGQRGTRVQTVITEMGGEKIDIIHYDEDAVKYIVHALSPAKITSVTLKEEAEGKKLAIAEVPDDQFSLAIGKSGQNVRLASRLTGWSIDIVRAEGGITENAEGNPENAEKGITENTEKVPEDSEIKTEEQPTEEKKEESTNNETQSL